MAEPWSLGKLLLVPGKEREDHREREIEGKQEEERSGTRPVLVVAAGGGVTGERLAESVRLGREGSYSATAARGRGGRHWLEGVVGRWRKSREVVGAMIPSIWIERGCG